MGITKTEEFSAEQNDLATLAKALGHPARIAILQHLLQVRACVCGDLMHILPLAQPTISQHLKELKACGIIQGRVEGKSVCYCLNAQRLEHLAAFLADLSAHSPAQNCC